jgi:predicted nucleic acid-binding protein
MLYLDTNVIIAYCIDNDPDHNRALNIIETLRQNKNKFYASTLSLVELYSVVSRNIQNYRLPPGIEELTDERIKIRTTIAYFLKLLSLHILSDEAKLIDLNHLKIFYEYFNAIKLAPLLKLKTLDLLHIVYAQELVTKKFIKAFITFDKEIMKKKDLILKTLKIEIISG